MNKKTITAVLVISVLFSALFILTGCTTEEKVDVSELCFNPVGVWVDISDGEPMFESFENGTLDYGADELGTWKVIGKDKISVFLGEDGEFEIDLVQVDGYDLIGNENATFCLEDDYEGAHEDIYLPTLEEQIDEEPEYTLD
jgi:hypothetical protein